MNLLQYDDDPVTNKRKPLCFPNKIQKYKPPLVASEDFPSKVSINKEYGSFAGETGECGEYGENGEFFSAMETRKKLEKPPITHWRRAEYGDREAVFKLIKKSDNLLDDLFGEPNVPDLIEKSSFALVQFNSEEEMISFTTIFSYPDIPAVPSFDWYLWLEKAYGLSDATPRNSSFIHYMVWDSKYYHDFFKLTLQTIFLENSYLSYLLITKPPKVKLPSIILTNFVQILPEDAKLYSVDANSLQTVLLCLRHTLLERLKIRLALVEDHDDLMPIAEQHTEKLKELYGDYCMAEIIEYPGTPERRTLVCESLGYAVGFMTLNKAVDFELLNSQFDLGVFHGLRKPSENDKISGAYADDPKETPVFLPHKIDPFLEIIDSETILKFLNWKPSLCAVQEDIFEYEPNIPEAELQYNELSRSMTNLLKETLNLRLAPKFSAHALSIVESSSVTQKESSSLSLSATSRKTYSDESPAGEESSIKSESSLVSLQHYNLPTYSGPPNAFLIEFFAMHKQFDDRFCQDFLEAAFEEFTDLEYCLLTIPSQAPTFPLLDFFTRVTPRPLKRFRQELYVCHKSCVMPAFMRVRKITKADLDEIQNLLKGIRNQEYIFADVVSSVYYEDSAYQGFVLICSKVIVGVAVLCNEHGMDYLAHHYFVSDLIDFDLHKIDYHAILKHLVLSPIYQPHARFFLRDVMRMADVTSLYRTRYEEAESNWNKSSLITTLAQLIPVKPRRMVKYHEPSLGENLPPEHFRITDMPFSLFHINSRVCGLTKFTCNINIVVVGSSLTAWSFLENLLFSSSAPYVTYHNLTWVSPHGMGTELPSHAARDLIFPTEGKYSKFYKIQLCVKTYVNFIYGIMTSINRVDKYITINNDSILPYDYLILLCGRQFGMPVPAIMLSDTKECRRNLRPRCTLFKYLITQAKKEVNKTVYPANVFIINTDVDATNAFISLQYLYQRRKNLQEEGKIIIYGHHISTYLCTTALLEYGIDPSLIVIVEPFPSKEHSISCFKDDKIDKAVLKELQLLGISHYQGYILYDWTLCDKNKVHSVTFYSEHRKVTLKCLAMLPFEKKLVSEVTFNAVNEASLVYDGKLVINSNFQTNDPNIYAAGGLTKYQRKYYAKNKNHINYSSSEVGHYLAEIIRKKIDPTENHITQEPSKVVPNMTEPLLIYGVLPGGWNYFSIRKPGKFTDPEIQAGIKEFGDVLVTGDCEMSLGRGYFKLVLDDFGFVSGIYCYTKDSIDVENLEMLYGKHEELLNNLLLRFDLGMITDFYSYFREPWVYAIYHDRFEIVLKKNREVFTRQKTLTEKSFKKPLKDENLINIIVDTLEANNWQKPSKETIMEIQQKFENSDLKAKVTENILNFLTYFSEPFPMYVTPRLLRVLLHDANKSILHKTMESKKKSRNANPVTARRS